VSLLSNQIMFQVKRSWFLILILFLSFQVSCVKPNQSLASPSQEFQTGWRQFHQLCKTPDKAKYRSYWLKVKKHFLKAYKEAPQGPYAPKCLYYLGRTYQELGKRSYLQKDFIHSVDYFQRVIQHFPDHSWSDDAKLYQAKVHLNHLNNPEQARYDLLYIIHNYKNGDMYPKAQKMLDQIKTKDIPKPEGNKVASSNSSHLLKKLNKIRHWSSDSYTRVVLDLDESANFNHFLLDPDPKKKQPKRLVVDLNQTMVSPKLKESIVIDDGLLQKVRAAQNTHKKTRVVLEIHRLEDYRVFSLQSPYRVVIDIYGPDYTNNLSQKEKAKLRSKAKGKDNKSISLIKQLGLDIRTVMLDPGHGGKDPGAVWGKIYEKDINLRMSRILGKILRDRGLEVVYTRTKDVFLPLEERTALANSKDVDLFISIHVNAHKKHSVQGLEIYYLNLAQSKNAIRVAARENAVSTKKISDLQVILSDLMLNSKIKESHNLAEIVLDKTLDYNKKHYSLDNNGVRRAPFYVLMGAKMPSILVELGYLTNAKERKRLQTYAYLKRIAWGIANGILAYKKEIQSVASSPYKINRNCLAVCN